MEVVGKDTLTINLQILKYGQNIWLFSKFIKLEINREFGQINIYFSFVKLGIFIVIALGLARAPILVEDGLKQVICLKWQWFSEFLNF